jgi:hypothetical protein
MPEPPECRFCHVGKVVGSSDISGTSLAARMRCDYCGAGFESLFRRTGSRQMAASIQIYPGAARQPRVGVDPRLVAWAMASFDGTVEEMESDGLRVSRESPVIH